MSVAVFIVLQAYMLLFDQIYVHPDEGFYMEVVESWITMEKTLGFVKPQLENLYSKFKDRVRSGICLPGVN